MTGLKDEPIRFPQDHREGDISPLPSNLTINQPIRLTLARAIMSEEQLQLAAERDNMGIVINEPVTGADGIVKHEREIVATSPHGEGFVGLLKAVMRKTSFDEQSYVKGAVFAHRALRVFGAPFPTLDEGFITGHVEELQLEAERARIDIHEVYRMRRAEWQERNPDLYDTVAEFAEVVNPIPSYDNEKEERDYVYFEDSLLAGSIDIITVVQRHGELEQIRLLASR